MKTSSLILGFLFVLSLVSFGDNPPVKNDQLTNNVEITPTTPPVTGGSEMESPEVIEVVEFPYDEIQCYDCVPKETLKFFEEEIMFPEIDGKCECGIVVVKFMYDSDGKIRVLDTNYSKEKLKEYVCMQLKKHKLSQSIVTPGKHYFARFDFIIQ